MSHKKKPMSCLPLVGVFILVGMCGIVVLYNLTQQDDYVKPSAPEPNWQVKTIHKTPENIRLEKPRTAKPQPRKTVVANPEKPPKEVNKFVWWDTPKEQGLKIGDWIKVIGWQRTFIGAVWDTQASSLKYSGDIGYLTLTPTDNGAHFPSHEIIGIFSEINITYNKEDVVNINNNLLKAFAVSGWGLGAAKVRLTAKISAVNPDRNYPNKWFLICSDAHVIYYPY